MNEVKEMSSITMLETHEGKVLEVHVTGKLAKQDYQQFVPVVERMVQQNGKIRMLVQMHDFHGWTAGAIWEDIKFDVKHFNDIERLAIVGEKRWQEGMSVFCKPFTAARIHYFDQDALIEARTWLLAP